MFRVFTELGLILIKSCPATGHCTKCHQTWKWHTRVLLHLQAVHHTSQQMSLLCVGAPCQGPSLKRSMVILPRHVSFPDRQHLMLTLTLEPKPARICIRRYASTSAMTQPVKRHFPEKLKLLPRDQKGGAKELRGLAQQTAPHQRMIISWQRSMII